MRIAIVNDAVTAVEAMRRVLAKAPQHSLAWTARDGAEAVKFCAGDRPDLILMDLIMPVMDGVEATRRIMAATPCPILVVTATVDGNSGRVFEALGAGALDAVNTPILAGAGAGESAKALLAKIDLLGRLTAPAVPAAPPAAPRHRFSTRSASHRGCLVGIGSSAGGPAALADLLRGLPRDFPAAIVVVQHLDEQFAAGLADWLGQQATLPVRLVRAGETPQPGTVLIAGRDQHLVLRENNTLGFTPLPAETPYRPSVDVFFASVAAHWRDDAVGVILTGMGRDGARGLKTMRDAGFPTIAQDKASSAVYGMPKAAVELGAAAQVLALTRIGPAIRQLVTVSTFPLSS
jgi:two-component system response regulator WspF